MILTTGYKKCPRCSHVKPDTAEFFARRLNGTSVARCLVCSANLKAKQTDADRQYFRDHAKAYYHAHKAERIAKAREWEKAHHAHCRERHLNPQTKYIHGITRAQYDARLAAQNHRCAICRSDDSGGSGQFHLDHDHTTGALRGFLCSRCNQGLGRFRDDPTLFEAAVAYLLRHRAEPVVIPPDMSPWHPPRLPRDAMLSPQWKSENRELVHRIRLRHRLKHDYGLTVNQYEDKLKTQANRCALCSSSDPGARGAFHLDHDHETGNVRDFLCVRCNHGLGYFLDSPDRLLAAAAYLRYHAAGGWAASFSLAS